MGIRHEWADDQQIILNIYIEAPWTWDEYRTATHEFINLITDTNHPCATIVDVTNYGSLPHEGNIIHTLLGIEKTLPENVFASALVGAPYAISVFMNMLTKLRPRAKSLAIFAQTKEEAQEKILERYVELHSQIP